MLSFHNCSAVVAVHCSWASGLFSVESLAKQWDRAEVKQKSSWMHYILKTTISHVFTDTPYVFLSPSPSLFKPFTIRIPQTDCFSCAFELLLTCLSTLHLNADVMFLRSFDPSVVRCRSLEIKNHSSFFCCGCPYTVSLLRHFLQYCYNYEIQWNWSKCSGSYFSTWVGLAWSRKYISLLTSRDNTKYLKSVFYWRS